MHMLAGYDPAPPQHLNSSCPRRTLAALPSRRYLLPASYLFYITLEKLLWGCRRLKVNLGRGGVVAMR